MTVQPLCAARGLTLEQLAERAGVERATVVKIDAGTVRLQPITRQRLAAVLDLDPATLRDELSAARRQQMIPNAPGSQLRERPRRRRGSGQPCPPARDDGRRPLPYGLRSFANFHAADAVSRHASEQWPRPGSSARASAVLAGRWQTGHSSGRPSAETVQRAWAEGRSLRVVGNLIPGCLSCRAPALKFDGRTAVGGHRFRCRRCRKTRTDRTGTPFARYRWPREVIVMAVRWYGRFRLSLRAVRDLLAGRGVDVSPRTVMKWVHTFGPLLAVALRRTARPVGTCWCVDETYVRVGGRWAYVYRAVDETGQVVEVLLRARRDLDSARAFFHQATRRRGRQPTIVVTDKHPAYGRAVRRYARRAIHIRPGLHRARGETTQPVERSHAPVKDRLRATRGLRSIESGQRVPETIEAIQAVRRGDLCLVRGGGAPLLAPAARARDEAQLLSVIAGALRDPRERVLLTA